MSKAIAKFRTNQEDTHPRASRNWNTISSLDVVKIYLRRNPLPPDPTHTPLWSREQLAEVLETAWPQANRFVRQVPSTKPRELPPVYTSNLSPNLERVASKWYLNNLPMRHPAQRALNPLISVLLSKNNLTELEAADLALNLSQVSGGVS